MHSSGRTFFVLVFLFGAMIAASGCLSAQAAVASKSSTTLEAKLAPPPANSPSTSYELLSPTL